MVEVVYFTCVWGENPRAWISRECDPDHHPIGEIKWRGQPVTVKLISGTPIEKDKVPEKYPPDLYALLKSNLQKQIRRKKIRAVATAARMLTLGQFELLRRLVVIAAEDAELSTETSVISWLMAAKSKGLQLTSDHKSWILGYVAALVNYPVCRRLEMKYNEYDYNERLYPISVLDSGRGNPQELAGILLRTAYGGLSCDPPMISQCVDYYLESNKKLPELLVTRWTDDLPKLLINRAAIDNHVWPGLIDKLQDAFPNYSADLLKLTIWTCSSRTNKRKNQPKRAEWVQCWNEIEPEFRKNTKIYLSRILKKYSHL